MVPRHLQSGYIEATVRCINLFVGTKLEVHKTFPHPLKTNRQRKESSLGLATVPLVWNQPHVLNKT